MDDFSGRDVNCNLLIAVLVSYMAICDAISAERWITLDLILHLAVAFISSRSSSSIFVHSILYSTFR